MTSTEMDREQYVHSNAHFLPRRTGWTFGRRWRFCPRTVGRILGGGGARGSPGRMVGLGGQWAHGTCLEDRWESYP